MSSGGWNRGIATLHQQRKQPGDKASESYNHADSACEAAVEKLGHKAQCLECPFAECLFVRTKR